MDSHGFQVAVGDQVFLHGNDEEIGAVRQVAKDHVTVYIENAGDFVVQPTQVHSAHDGKLVLDPAKADATLIEAARKAHANETE